MADNIAVTAGSGTTIGADDVGAGVLHQRVKVTWGPDGTGNDADTATGKPLPVQLRGPTGTDLTGTAGTASAAVQTVQGIASMTPLLATVTNAGTFAVQSASTLVAETTKVIGTVNPGNTANTTAWKVDGSAVTQPVSIASVPSHAVTNAGTFAVQATNTPLTNMGAGEYETVAASQTAQTLGATGATGDYISGLLVVPATTSPGNVLLLDNATSITVFVGGASSVSNLVPFFIPLGMISVSGAWKVTTSTNVSVIGIGNFT